MMAAQHIGRTTSDRLVDRLPVVRGRYSETVAMAPFTWFRVGGVADVVFRPADTEDLAIFLASQPLDVPVTVIGVDTNASQAAFREGRSGLEFLSGIPGSIGGGLRMNAGAYGAEFKDALVEAEAIDQKGTMHCITVEDMGMGYRHCDLPGDWIFTSGRFEAPSGGVTEIQRRMTEIRLAREASQPIRARTGGSTFANPEGGKAWELIDVAGCRGLRVGGAMVSELHCNFLINTGTATARDLEALGEEVRRRVLDTSGVALRWEIRRIGEPELEEEVDP
jgi:UDP-N-acetylmuramate dehydrogenase